MEDVRIKAMQDVMAQKLAEERLKGFIRFTDTS